MGLVTREAITPVALPEEQVPLPEAGGDVLVQGMDLPRLQRFAAARRRALEPKAGEAEADAQERAGTELLPLALELCVLAGDGQPVYSYAQWASFAARHPAQAMALFSKAMELSGQGDEKKA